MKTKMFKITAVLLVLAGSFSFCSKKVESEGARESFYYYYFGEKIYLKQVKDKILFRFAPDAEKEQARKIIGSAISLRPRTPIYWDDYHLYQIGFGFCVVLESKSGKKISSATIEHFKARKEIVSVEYMYSIRGRGFLLGLTDEFIVKLKETTTYEQLLELTEQNHCSMVEQSRYVEENRYIIYVSKTPHINALQAANLFYETGFFEGSSPNFFGAMQPD